MFSRYLLVKIAFGVLLFTAACSVLKKEDPEKEIVAFLTTFQNTLSQPDEAILDLFDAKQSKESILSVVKILQNKEHEFILCTALYNQPQISKEETGIKVVIPVNFAPQNIEEDFHEETSITFWLKPGKDSFVITKVEGEEFYKSFASIRGNLEWSVERIRELKKREQIYTRAAELQQRYDSVIWFATHEKKNYYYVVKGSWTNYFYDDNPKSSDYTMGLVDEAGEVIIPVEYELIGTLAFEVPGMVEIKKEGKAGYFNLETRQLVIPAAYDMIIPYAQDNSFAIVKQDSIYGWIDRTYQYHEGFPSENSARWVKSFEFLPKNLKLQSDTRTFCEIPNQQGAGYGIIMPPSYLVTTGVFREIVGGISTTPVPLNGWTDYVETKGTLLQAVTDKINAVITTITERYIDGREEFYTYNRLTLVDGKQDTLAVSSFYTSGEIVFRKLNDSLLELKCDQDSPEGSEFDEYNMPVYTYFSMSEDLSVNSYTSHRSFPQSQFVKLDSTYLSGNFKVWTEEGERESKFLSLATITYMRDEILADYGFRFADATTQERFKYYNWYRPQYDKVEDFQEQLSDEDRHNLDFLNRMIEMLKSKPV
ncbi:YARHG domain-containing protein [Ohtaekwangia kribbensis]|jgi:hypothetical protein|uniref:YARHG domain-containing protein n=1 Tax=Ohtaekwangia kribbensis TaxID=688913 RepID=A0ABW3K5K1_9BACT